jgi:hypothetical protein
MASITNLVRSKGDPKIVETGPSSVYPEDRLAKSLGWFSIGLGLLEIIAASKVTRALGMRGTEGVVRAFGAREVASGIATLSPDRKVGLQSRVAGDAIDMAVLLLALTPYNPKRNNVKAALMGVAAITALDVVGARAVSARQLRKTPARLYHDRSGFPGGFSGVRNKPIPPHQSGQRSLSENA